MRTGAAARSAETTTERPKAPGAALGRNGTGARNGETIGECVLRSLDQYFQDLDGARPHQLYDMVLQAVERPLLQFALARCENNQSAAADLLGINRNTLRKKLIGHGLAEAPAPKPAAVRKRAPARRKR